jgi:RimJ/RimL family protein N-acetyltransferase
MHTHFITRKATPSDLSTLLLFEQEIIKAERPFDPTIRPDPVRYYDLEGMLVDPQVEVQVAEAEGELVGVGYARVSESRHFLDHTQHAYLGFMYVVPAHRGTGVIQRILEVLKEWAFSRGLTELRLEVYSENTNAIRAYEKAGFMPLMTEMRLRL